jgi:hypothetical protein
MTELRPYNGHREASGQFVPRRESGGDFVAALQNAVRENPLSAALIGMGIAWMFMGGSKASLFGDGGIFGIARPGADRMMGAASEASASMGAQFTRAAHAVTQPAWQAGTGAAAGFGDAASRTAARAGDAAVSGYHAVTDTASRAAETMSNVASSAANSVAETATQWGSGVHGTLAGILDRQPLLLGAVGLAIGAGLAASLPPSKTEKNLMGSASDFVREKVSDKVAEVGGQLKEMADAALGEAKAQGITPETAGETLRTFAQKMNTDQSGGSNSTKSNQTKSGAPRKS